MATDTVTDIEIPIWVKGTQKWVTGLTKRTTCDDVIYALLYQDGLHEHVNTSAYAVFEKWREVERPLQGRTKIVKVWRAWGAEQPNVHLSMRRIDELEYSGEFSLTRRKKKSRHKSRERERDRERERERRSRDHRHHHYCQNASERLRSMEALVKLVISQERKLKDMIEHGDDTEKLIEKYESRLHAKRLKQNGDEYVKDAYTDTLADDSLDEFFSMANIEELEIYVNYCDKILEMEEKIKNEHSKIEDLAYQIQTYANDAKCYSDATNETDDITQVQVNLNRAVSCAIMQQYKFQDLQRELQFYEEKLQDKEAIYKRLETELNNLDDNSIASSESINSSGSANSNNSASSVSPTGSGNLLPLPERRNRLLTQSDPPTPPPVPERSRVKEEVAREQQPRVQNVIHNQSKECLNERKPILKSSASDSGRNGYAFSQKTSATSETKVRFKTDSLVDKYQWEESSLSEGISIDQSDCSDPKDLFEYVNRTDYSQFKPGVADQPYLTVKVEDNDSNSDTGLSSMHSDDSAVYHLETLV